MRRRSKRRPGACVWKKASARVGSESGSGFRDRQSSCGCRPSGQSSGRSLSNRAQLRAHTETTPALWLRLRSGKREADVLI
jgi:hypothetical protein